jgi:hypothetical protein
VFFTKSGGPLTKSITLAADGSLKSDGSACVMPSGRARRLPVSDAAHLSAVIAGLRVAPEAVESSGVVIAAPVVHEQQTHRAIHPPRPPA